jgi:hypothetical protein
LSTGEGQAFGATKILGMICGLTPEAAKDIFSHSDFHESEEDQIHSYFDLIRACELQDACHIQPREQLRKLGFNEERGHYLAEWYESSSLQNHLSLVDYAHIYIQDLFIYDSLLANQLPKLPDESKGNEVYKVDGFASNGQYKSILCRNFGSNENEGDPNQFFIATGEEYAGG